MFPFFVLFFAMWIISGILWRLITTWTSGTELGAVTAYVH